MYFLTSGMQEASWRTEDIEEKCERLIESFKKLKNNGSLIKYTNWYIGIQIK